MILDLFEFLCFIFSSIVLSTIDCFNVFPYNKVITLIQYRSLVYLVCNFEKYPFVIKLAIDINRAVLEDILLPTLKFEFAKLPEFIVEADPIINSVIINKSFCPFKDSYFFLFFLHYQL